jgi:integrase
LKGLPRTALKEISPLTFEEVRYILSNADGWFKNFMTLAFFTGMRTGEMLALRWEDVNLHSGKIIVRSSMTRGKIGTTKTGKVREIDVLDPVMQALREQFKETGLRGGFVFYSNKTQNAFTNSSSIAKINWKPLLKRLLIGERTLYQTRHTFATMMISKGEDIMWVSNMLGHADSSITLSIYARYRENKTVKRASFLDKVEVFNAVRETRTCHVSVTQENLELEIKLA